MLFLKNVCKSYKTPNGNHIVLNDATIKFQEGKSTAILGLNGAGKSTLIRIISGAEKPDSGKIIRDARVSWPVGFAGGFHGSLTGRENLRFVSRIYGANLKKVTQFVEEFAELGDYLDMPFNTYSSGMRSKLSFGLSLAIEFDFYLVDEAFSVGDVTFRQKATNELKKLKEKATLIFVSHSINAVKEHCQVGAVLYKGNLSSYDNLNDAIKAYDDICQKQARQISLNK